jgi:REP element-mobilizing transposase RayT
VRIVTYNPEVDRRRSIRLPHWDYRESGAYFVTICTHNRLPLFGRVVEDQTRLNQFGRVVEEEWGRSADIRAEITLDAFVVMPNHVHGIVWIRRAPTVGAQGLAPLRNDARVRFAVQSMSLSSMIRGFKSASKLRVNALRRMPRVAVWQRNYFERVLRNDRELDRAREYILDNPRRWAEDKHNPAVLAKPAYSRDQP